MNAMLRGPRGGARGRGLPQRRPRTARRPACSRRCRVRRRLLTPQAGLRGRDSAGARGGRGRAPDRGADGEQRAGEPGTVAHLRAGGPDSSRRQAFDPAGDGEEHSSDVSLAIDGNPEHHLDDRDLRRVALGPGRGREARRRPDRGRVQAGDRQDAHDPLATRAGGAEGLRRRHGTADDPPGAGRARSERSTRKDRPDGASSPRRAPSATTCSGSRSWLRRQRLQRRDRRGRALELAAPRSRSELESAPRLVPLERQLDEPVAELRVGNRRRPRTALRTRWST